MRKPAAVTRNHQPCSPVVAAPFLRDAKLIPISTLLGNPKWKMRKAHLSCSMTTPKNGWHDDTPNFPWHLKESLFLSGSLLGTRAGFLRMVIMDKFSTWPGVLGLWWRMAWCHGGVPGEEGNMTWHQQQISGVTPVHRLHKPRKLEVLLLDLA